MDEIQLEFEEWAGPEGFCLDQIFMSKQEKRWTKTK